MKRSAWAVGVFALVVLMAGIAVVRAEFATPTGVVINEIMYNPPWDDQVQMTDAKYEWIELVNPTLGVIDMGGYRITTDAGYEMAVPTGTKIEAGGYLIIASDARAFTGGLPNGWTVTCPVVGNSGNDTPILGNMGGTVRVYDRAGELKDEVTYSDRSPWPSGLGSGSTLELVSPLRDNADPASWQASTERGYLGTPGKPNSVLAGSELWQGAASAVPATVGALARLESQAFTVRNDDARAMEGVALTLPLSWLWSGRTTNVSVAGAEGTVTVSGDGRPGKPYVIRVTGIDVASGAQLTLTLAKVTSSPQAGAADEFVVEASDGERWYPLQASPSVTVTETTRRAEHIVINEVYNNGGDSISADYCDWFELYNPTSEPVCIDGWYVFDALPRQALESPREGTLRIPDPTAGQDYVLQPGGYMLIVLDEQSYRSEFPQGAAPALEGNLDCRSRTTTGQRILDPSKDGPAPNCSVICNFGLNKNRDELVLYDGEKIVDAVAWGNGNSFNMLTSEPLICRHGLSLARKQDGYEAQQPNGELSELVGNSFMANAQPTPGTANR